MLPLLSSIELLLADVESIRSSEMSLKQLAALIDEEFHGDIKHMESKDENLRDVENMKKKVFSLLMTFMKLSTGLFFCLAIAFLLSPHQIAFSASYLHGYLFTEEVEAPKYNISDVHWYFSLLQILRLGSTRLHLERKFPLTDIDMDSCIIDNPLYRPGKLTCSICKGGFVYDRNEINSYGGDNPVIVKSNNIKFTVARLQQLLHKEKMMLNQHTVSIKTNCDYIHTVEDLKDNGVLERLEGDNTSHVTGTSLSYMSSHILRKEFPRPQDYFAAAQTYQTFLYLDGKKSSSYQLSKTASDSQSMYLYIQCSGSRRVVFSPPDHCHYNCQTFSRIMKPGDLVFYSNTWTVHSEPSNERSLVYVDIFDLLP